MSRGVQRVAVVGMVGAMLAGLSLQAGARGAVIPMHLSSVARAGVVDIASLPRAGGHIAGSGTLQEIPLGKLSGDSPVASAPRSPVTAQAPLVTVSAGPMLSGGLRNDDNTLKLTPPDMGLGADRTHVMEMVNDVGRIWTRSVAGAAFQLNPFFMAGSNFIGDPWVIYDQESKRWFAGVFDIALGGARIAVSKTGNPSASWSVYTIQYPGVAGGGCPDQGKGGVDNNVVALGFNEFAGNGCTGGYLGAGIEIFNKAQMIAGAASVDFTFTTPQPQYFSLVPAQALTNGQTTEFFAGTDFSSTSKALHRLTSTGVPGVSAVTLTPLSDLTLSTAHPSPPGAKQLGTTALLDTGDSRMQHVVWKGGVGLAMSWAQSCTPAGDTTARACARVVTTNDGVSGPAVTMDQILSSSGQYYFYPAATLNASNDVVVAFAVSSATIFPQLDAAAAAVGGTFTAALKLAAGTSANTTGRYGDYFAVALDPSGTTPNQRVWAAGEIGGPASNDWQTAIRKVKVTP